MPFALLFGGTHLRPAKEDALSALATCCCSYGSEAIQDHLSEVRGGVGWGCLLWVVATAARAPELPACLATCWQLHSASAAALAKLLCQAAAHCARPQIWSALRNEVLAPSAFGVVGGEELSAKRGLAAAAASCLGRIMARLPATAARLQELAVKDACTTGLVATVRSAGAASAGAGVAAPAASDPGRTDRSVMCTAALLGAVREGGAWLGCGPAAAAALQQPARTPRMGRGPGWRVPLARGARSDA